MQDVFHFKHSGKVFAAACEILRMKSKASIKSHPIHPILIAFPIAFFTGSFIFDLLAILFRINNFHTTAAYLNISGVISGLVAAVPGIIDLIYTVPPKSSGKKRGIQHGLINTLNILLFLSIWLYRRDNTTPSASIILTGEAIGLMLLMIAGWMGGTLVYRNQIGVDPRYAFAGKWKEIHVDRKKGEMEVATADELLLNQMKLIHVGNERIALGKTENGYKAFEDRCPHKGGSLAGGSLMCGTVQCPWHGSQFDVCDGKVKAGPAKTKIKTYQVKEENGKIYLLMD